MKSPFVLPLLGLLSFIVATPASADIVPAQSPLFLALRSAKPNVMLMIDNSGSMDRNVTTTTNIAVDAPDGFSYSCPNSLKVGGSTSSNGAPTIYMIGCGTTPRIGSSTSCSSSKVFGNTSSRRSSRRCFDNTKWYTISGPGFPDSSPHQGIDLNYYFSQGSFNNSLAAVLTVTQKRIEIAREAAIDLVDNLIPGSGQAATLRMGLSTFSNASSPHGGVLLDQVKDLDETHASAIKSDISDLLAESWTPLAETLSDIGRYFTTGYTGNLTLSPGSPGNISSVSASVDTVFNSHNLSNSTGESTIAAPITSACQKSFVIMVTDGLPTKDRSISSNLQDYDGDCSGSNAANCRGCRSGYYSGSNFYLNSPISYETSHWDMKKSFIDAGKYECPADTEPSEYLDDVAKALHDTDLRPDISKVGNSQKNNLTLYTVGFADPAIDPTVTGNVPVLKSAAEKAGGQFYYAANARQLAEALDNTIEDISGRVAASATVAANSTRIQNDTLIYQARFDSSSWIGSLLAFPVIDSGSNQGSLGSAIWDAADGIPAHGSRTILTYNPSAAAGSRGKTFVCANLSATQKAALGIAATDCTSTSDQGIWRLNYLRGDISHEQINSMRVKDIADETRPAGGIFRNRTIIDETTGFTRQPDPWLLGDIVNSNPAFVWQDDFGYDKLSGTEGSSYATFRSSSAYTTRRPMLYVGANDGMLHGFDATKTGTYAGTEVMAYVPNSVYGNLSRLSDPNYNHVYFVDGSPRTGDVYFGSAWHTVLVGTTGAGGKGLFALDVTNPGATGVNPLANGSNAAAFGGGDVLWEISDADAPLATDLTTSTTLADDKGFTNNLGFTMAQPSIVRMRGGYWAAIVANGYGSVKERAVLYIINIANGNIIRTLDTGVGSSTAPNGLSTPIAVDTDEDRMVNTIYAGDLRGNLWKFDVNYDTPADWKVANGGLPLYVACASSTTCAADSAERQPITAKPQVGKGPDGGFMVYFGTGKYFEESDNSNTNLQTQTFYGIWDNGAAITGRGNLVGQTITSEPTVGNLTLRLTSDNSVDWATKKGWYMDLLQPASPSPLQKGERVTAFPALRGTRIIFTTMIPKIASSSNTNATQCDTSGGSGWLMILNAQTGQPLSTSGAPPFDVNGDKRLDSNSDSADRVNGGYASGTKQDGIPTAPTFIGMDTGHSLGGGTSAPNDSGCTERGYSSLDPATMSNTLISCDGPSGNPSGRQSWRQLQ